jgi:hypothetical protein
VGGGVSGQEGVIILTRAGREKTLFCVEALAAQGFPTSQKVISHAPRAPGMKTFSANGCFCPVALREEGRGWGCGNVAGGAARAAEGGHADTAAGNPGGLAGGSGGGNGEIRPAQSKFERDGERPLEISVQFLIVLTCRDEKHQVELLERFPGEGLECKALVG